jgi:hypothetical protein
MQVFQSTMMLTTRQCAESILLAFTVTLAQFAASSRALGKVVAIFGSLPRFS